MKNLPSVQVSKKPDISADPLHEFIRNGSKQLIATLQSRLKARSHVLETTS
ncbi:MAG: hypothetical protein ACTS73_08680 [Arsenophonus sp. NEOnobi-MAG3]